ncbi:MAG: CsgG/HfaB family protein [Patescibacteria group bacterium]
MIMVMVAVVLMGGCANKVDFRPPERAAAQAVADRPIATEVVPISIPHDDTKPMWVVVVEPFDMGASGVTSGNAPETINPGEQIGRGVSAQLATALRRVGNISVMDQNIYERRVAAGTFRLGDNERGPYIIKGTVTEFGETNDQSGQGYSTGPNVPAMFIPYVGGIVSYGIGTEASAETERRGMVAFDLQIIEPETGRLLTSFVSEGTFVSVAKSTRQTKWGNTTTKSDAAASAIGQAQRVALNKAVTQIHAELAARP